MLQRTWDKVPACRLGLIGDHPWARALVEAAQLRGGWLRACAGPPELLAWAVRLSAEVATNSEAQAVLSDTELDIIILADALPFRGQLLMEAVQLDKAVLVIHPAELEAERYYVVQLAIEERRFPVWPMLPHRFFPGLEPLRSWLRQIAGQSSWQLEASVPLADNSVSVSSGVSPQLTDSLLGAHPLWYWADWLRLIGGEVAEVYAVSDAARLDRPACPLTVTGRWEQGGHFVLRFARHVAEGFQLSTNHGTIIWQGATVIPGEYQLSWRDAEKQDTYSGSSDGVWAAYADWLLQSGPSRGLPPQWLDVVAVAEIVQAVEESLRRRKAVSLLHQEYTESAVFKSRVATLGCGLVWAMLVLAMISPLVPQVLYLIPGLLLICLGLFVLGWLAFRR
ncbi:hypothetical protein HRbin36_01262 [bacterium HR36]|nr:hypothetical protein HRbin36_01262 [bacterium HR36]